MTHFNHSLNPLTDLNSITTSQNHQEQAPYIPDEMIKKIFEKLESKDLSNCIEVCKQWSQSAKNLMDDSWILDLKYRKGVYTSKNYLGHIDGVKSVVLSVDENKLFSGSWNGTIKILDVETGDCLRTLEGHAWSVSSLVLSADGKKLFSGSWDKTIKIWDVETGNCLHTLQGHAWGINSVVLSADGKKLFSSSGNEAIKIWNIETGDCLHALQGHTSMLNSFALSADGKRLFSCSLDKTIKIWDVETGDCLHTLRGHKGSVKSVVLSADGKKLFSSSSDDTIKIWDVETGDCLKSLEGHRWGVTSVVLSADGKKLFSGSGDKTIKIWDVETGNCLHTLQGHEGSVNSVVLSADEKKLFSGSGDKTIKIWDIETGDCLQTLQGYVNCFGSLALSADGKKLFSGSSDKAIKIWNFGASSMEVFEEIANLFQENTEESTEQALERFERMPLRAKQAIYGELYSICKPFQNDYWDCAKHAFHNQHQQSSTPVQKAKAIWNYLANSIEFLEEIANLFQKNSEESIKQALEHFERMPLSAKQAIYEELYSICKPFQNDYPGCAEHAFHDQCDQSSTPAQKADAILSYLRKQNAKEENPDPSKTTQVSGSVLKINHTKELESSVKVTEITDLDTISKEAALDALEVHDFLADLGIVTQKDCSEKLKSSFKFLSHVGLKTSEDLKALGLHPLRIEKLVLNIEECQDNLGLQKQAGNNKQAILSFVETLLEVVDKKVQESNDAPLYPYQESPWISLQVDLKTLKKELDHLDSKSQNLKTLLENFGLESCVKIAEEANALAVAIEAMDKTHQIAKLSAYVQQYGIYKLWTRLQSQGIKNLSTLLQLEEAPQDLFRMGE